MSQAAGDDRIDHHDHQHDHVQQPEAGDRPERGAQEIGIPEPEARERLGAIVEQVQLRGEYHRHRQTKHQHVGQVGEVGQVRQGETSEPIRPTEGIDTERWGDYVPEEQQEQRHHPHPRDRQTRRVPRLVDPGRDQQGQRGQVEVDSKGKTIRRR